MTSDLQHRPCRARLLIVLGALTLSACVSRREVSFAYWPPQAVKVAVKRPVVLDPVRDSRPQLATKALGPHQVGHLPSGEVIEVEDRVPLAGAVGRALMEDLVSLGFRVEDEARTKAKAKSKAKADAEDEDEVDAEGDTEAEPEPEPLSDVQHLAVDILEWTIEASTDAGFHALIDVSVLAPDGTVRATRRVQYRGSASVDPYWGPWVSIEYAHPKIFANLVHALVRTNEPILKALYAAGGG